MKLIIVKSNQPRRLTGPLLPAAAPRPAPQPVAGR